MFESMADKMAEFEIPDEVVPDATLPSPIGVGESGNMSSKSRPNFGSLGTSPALPSMPVLSTKISKYQSFANIQPLVGAGLKTRAASLGGGLSGLGSRPQVEPKRER